MAKQPTYKELAVLSLLRAGMSQQTIARSLSLSSSRISAILRTVRTKLYATGISGACSHVPALLTHKERKVLWLLKEGYKQVHVAQILHISQPAVSQFLRNARRKIRDARALLLTPTQTKVYLCMKKGMQQKVIAKRLGVSQPAISHVVQAIKRKYMQREELSRIMQA